MSKDGYWKHKTQETWKTRDKKASAWHPSMHIALRNTGRTLIRQATNGEDQSDKWDYLWLDKDEITEMKIDYKVCHGVQESHKILFDQGKLKTTHYFRRHNDAYTLISAKGFWNSTLSKRYNPRTNQHFYVKI